jgi:uncharacterized protein with von Willebrand factor type A (vWA) domain
MQITVAPGYLPPSDHAIQVAASQAELKLEVPDFVRDVCNIYAGGNFISQEEINIRIQNEWDSTRVRKEFIGNKYKFIRGDNNSSYDNYMAAHRAFFNDKENMARKVQETINSMESMDVPGNTPLEQSVNLINLLLKQRYGSADASGMNSDDVMNELLKRNNVNKAKQNIQDASNLSQLEEDLLEQIAELKNKNNYETTRNRSGFGGKGISDCSLTGPTAKGKRVIRNAMHLADAQLAEVIRISRKMKSFSKLKTSKIQEFTPDVEGNQVRNRAMKNYGEFARIKSEQYTQKVTIPKIFNYRAATNQYMIRERGIFHEKKQLLYVLVDCSGSMAEGGGSRINMAAGILVNRLMAVAKGDATVYWRFFDTTAHACTFVDSKEKAQKSISKIIEHENYDGGGTNFDAALCSAVEHIESLRESVKFSKPEIFMVTDGGCSCSVKLKDLKGIKLHAGVVSSEYSNDLFNLVSASGGAYIDFCS